MVVSRDTILHDMARSVDGGKLNTNVQPHCEVRVDQGFSGACKTVARGSEPVGFYPCIIYRLREKPCVLELVIGSRLDVLAGTRAGLHMSG